MFSYSEAFILQYNTEEPHWADPLEMKFQLVDFLVNRRQSGRCFISGKSLTLYEEETSGARYGEVDGLFPVAAESEGWHLLWVRSASRVHSSLCDSGYLPGRAFLSMGFRAIDIPKESRRTLRAKFGKEMNGWPLLEMRGVACPVSGQAKPFSLMESFLVLHRGKGVPLKALF